ncbi:MAG: site-specific tyrosine recombinase XerD [Bacillota bacterium]|nr:site-specific tyrosine recombinase XerD [Bacillota bacterium]
MFFQQMDGFLNHLKIEKSASDLTLVSYRTDLRQFVGFLADENNMSEEKVSVGLVNHRSVRDYLALLQDSGMSRATMARKLASLRSFVRYLCRENILETNPIANVSTPRQEKKLPSFLYPVELELLLNAPDKTKQIGRRDRAILETLYAAGLRVSELVGLNISDLHLQQEYIKVTGKGNKERLAPMGSQAVLAMEEYLTLGRSFLLEKNCESSEAVFLNRFGTRLSERSIRNIINKYVEEVAINQKVSPHTFRHTFATHLLNGGADLRSVQELLGHVKLSTTQIYTHVTKDNIKSIHSETHPRR